MTPHYDVNPNTGNEIATDLDLKIVENFIHHNKVHPSRIILPVIPRN